jgi:NTF2 fold immunity protein
MTLKKGSSYIMQLLDMNIVKDGETAIELAEVIIRHQHGSQFLKLQQPLSVKDDGDNWIIDGAPDALDSSNHTGPMHIKLMKADASVLSFHSSLPKALHDELAKIKPNTDKTSKFDR